MGSGAVEIMLRIWVERLRPAFTGRRPRYAQNPHALDVSVPRLGLTGGVTRLCRMGGGDGVLGVGLSLAPPALSIGTVDFDDPHALGLEVTGEAGTIGTRPFDTDQLDAAKVTQPTEQLLVTLGRGSKALDAEKSSSFIQSCSYMDVEVRIDATGDASWQIGHCHPFVGFGLGWHHTKRDDGQDSDGTL